MAKWGTFGPWKAQTEAAAIALNQKVVDKFFLKVCAEQEGAHQGAWPQRPVSPLLSPLMIFSSFLSFNLSQVFFPSLYLLFLPLLFHFLSFPCFPLSFSLLSSYGLSLYPSLPAFFFTFLSPFLSLYLLFLSFLSLYPLSL